MTTLSLAVPARRTAWHYAPLMGMLAGGGAVVALLLLRYPYSGLYGQDSYTYYYQALALWQDVIGQAPPPDALFSSQELRWPIGYHLHIMLGFLFGMGPEGGRALTLLMTATAPALVYLLVGALWVGAPARARLVAGGIAGGALLLTGTYARFGLSLMADVPALWWNVLAFYCFLRAWPPGATDPIPAARVRWAVGGGLALGVAVLVRYGSAMLGVPLLIYLLLRWWARRGGAGPTGAPGSALGWAGLGGLIGLLPQAVYDLTHRTGAGYSRFLSDWDPGNLFRTTLVSADGTATFSHTPLFFYLVSPLGSASSGFLSYWYLPALALGLLTLVWGRHWAVLGLLLSWWLVPALFFSGTPYQAHRFTLAFLPALTILIGIGGAMAVEAGLITVRQRSGALPQLVLGVVAAGVVLGLGLGAWQGQKATREWVAMHAGFEASERHIAALAEAAAQATGRPGAPHVVSFGTTPALYHYTHWLIEDFYIYDEASLTGFLQTPTPRLVVAPEQSLATQWAGTPSGARWDWLRAHYTLHLAGRDGDFGVYTVEDSP